MKTTTKRLNQFVVFDCLNCRINATVDYNVDDRDGEIEIKDVTRLEFGVRDDKVTQDLEDAVKECMTEGIHDDLFMAVIECEAELQADERMDDYNQYGSRHNPEKEDDER